MSDFDYKAELAKVPEEPGVYRYFDSEGTVIYVGKAKNLKNRVSSYFVKSNQHDRKTKRLVSQIRKNIACERCRAGLDDNWTQYLGQIMACCNSHAGRARQSVSNYEAVFGMKYHTGIKCSLKEMRECRNISERLRISPDERLAKLVEEMDIVVG